MSVPVRPGRFGWRVSQLVLLTQNPQEPEMDGGDLCVDPWDAGPPAPISKAHHTQQLKVGPCPLLAHCVAAPTIPSQHVQNKDDSRKPGKKICLMSRRQAKIVSSVFFQ